MSRKAVDQILERLIDDVKFREKFEQDRADALAPYALSGPEVAGLAAVDLQTVIGAATGVKKISIASIT